MRSWRSCSPRTSRRCASLSSSSTRCRADLQPRRLRGAPAGSPARSRGVAGQDAEAGSSGIISFISRGSGADATRVGARLFGPTRPLSDGSPLASPRRAPRWVARCGPGGVAARQLELQACALLARPGRVAVPEPVGVQIPRVLVSAKARSSVSSSSSRSSGASIGTASSDAVVEVAPASGRRRQ